MQLKRCLYRQVDDDGEVLCGRIKRGDRAVTGDDCQACPIAEIDCSHLRAALFHAGHPPLLVRYGNGRTEIWDDPTPPLAFERAACAAQVQPLHSSHDCIGCVQRQPPIRPTVDRRPQSATSGQAAAAVPGVSAQKQVRRAAEPVIPLEPRLARPPATPAPLALREPVPVAPLPRGQERRVGWAD